MSQVKFKILFFRHYDNAIAMGVTTFSKMGIAKNDFTRLCSEPSFVLDRASIERAAEAMKLSPEETLQLIDAADTERGE